MPTEAYATFETALADAQQLLNLYDTAQGTGEPPERIEVLKRASMILAVTAWETYVEDLLKEKFPAVLEAAKSPADLPSAFEQVAKRWLKNSGAVNAAGLTSWTGNGWQEHIRKSFDDEVAALNTPNSKNARRLFSNFLNVDLATLWRWQGIRFAAACERLDGIVSQRGAFTHTARKKSGSRPAKHALKRSQVMSCLDFLQQIALATDAFGTPNASRGSLLD